MNSGRWKMVNVDLLRERARIVREVRKFFDERDFIEVETAVRIAAPAPEEHIDCPECAGMYLRASPELQMKKLLAEGMDRIYQIGPCFREGERGARHNPEFTMLEWYRRKADYNEIADDLRKLFIALADASFFIHHPSFRELRVREAYAEFAGWDPFVNFDQDRFDFDMATKIEPAIKAMGGGVFLFDYPPEAASLARLHHPSTPDPSDPPYAERWEFYWDGMELANCFTELCDRTEQTRRFERAKANRMELGEADYPLDFEFLECLPRIDNAAGVALGIDRLVMVLTGISEISHIRPNL